MLQVAFGGGGLGLQALNGAHVLDQTACLLQIAQLGFNQHLQAQRGPVVAAKGHGLLQVVEGFARALAQALDLGQAKQRFGTARTQVGELLQGLGGQHQLAGAHLQLGQLFDQGGLVGHGGHGLLGSGQGVAQSP